MSDNINGHRLLMEVYEKIENAIVKRDGSDMKLADCLKGMAVFELAAKNGCTIIESKFHALELATYVHYAAVDTRNCYINKMKTRLESFNRTNNNMSDVETGDEAASEDFESREDMHAFTILQKASAALHYKSGDDSSDVECLSVIPNKKQKPNTKKHPDSDSDAKSKSKSKSELQIVNSKSQNDKSSKIETEVRPNLEVRLECMDEAENQNRESNEARVEKPTKNEEKEKLENDRGRSLLKNITVINELLEEKMNALSRNSDADAAPLNESMCSSPDIYLPPQCSRRRPRVQLRSPRRIIPIFLPSDSDSSTPIVPVSPHSNTSTHYFSVSSASTAFDTASEELNGD